MFCRKHIFSGCTDDRTNSIPRTRIMRTASRFVIVIIFLGVVLGGIFGYKFYQFGQMQEQFSQPQPPAKISATMASTSVASNVSRMLG